MSWRGGGPYSWALAVACRGGGSASLGWASVPWEKAPDLDCELRPAGPDAGARVRGRWVGIQPQDSPSPPRESREPEQRHSSMRRGGR